MSFSALAVAQVQRLKPAAALPAASAEQIGKIRRTSHEFEAQLASQMLQPMFEGLSSDGEFDGGQAEGTWRGFMVDAMGKQMARARRWRMLGEPPAISAGFWRTRSDSRR